MTDGATKTIEVIATKTIEVYKSVADISAEERRRIFVAVATLCGDVQSQYELGAPPSAPPAAEELAGFPVKAARWLSQNRIPPERMEEIFHIDGSNVELILVEMIGKSRREQTINCYLLEGLRSLIATGEPTLADSEVVALCKKYKCHDVANHAAYRRQSANYLAGDKDRGFVLSAPGLRAAAEIVRVGQ